MTTCDKCHHYHWDDITIWRCGNPACGELYPDANGNPKENQDSAEFVKAYQEMADKLRERELDIAAYEATIIKLQCASIKKEQ